MIKIKIIKNEHTYNKVCTLYQRQARAFLIISAIQWRVQNYLRYYLYEIVCNAHRVHQPKGNYELNSSNVYLSTENNKSMCFTCSEE